MGSDESRIEAIFYAAMDERSAAQRDAYLDRVCADDPVLRGRVESLLNAQSKLGRFLENDRRDDAVSATLDAPRLAERLGTQIGPYKLHQEIGEGGMGVVYMALQKEPVRRKVALKIIKPGMDSREVIARFAAEEQALAMMDHPNIARVFDAGTTESGRPYFIMELVNGVPITQYCDDNNSPTRQRLELFTLVCHAVQHAHQKGIIHRDIKPSNILVTLHDGVPVPKVIDFGIAKAINQELTSKSMATGVGHMIGTPLYMSPEQAERSGLDIDTRSDIYSLGVLLYELLTGSTPFASDQFKDVGLDEVRRLIREQEPPRPSTRISTMGKAATTVSGHRRTNPVELSNSLRHELDWIVMKSLDKDRTRRYQTANDFARDIQRYLDDEPVEACPPSRIYRLQKFTRRNRTAVLATAAVGLSLILGAGVAAGQAYRATKAEKYAEEQLRIATEQQRLAKQQAQLAQKQKRRAEDAAEREAKLRVEAEQATQQAEAARKQAETVTNYLVDIFRSPDPEKDGRTVTVVEVLDRAKKALETKLSDDVTVNARLLAALGKTYRGLGLYEESLTQVEQCHKILRDALGSEHPATLAALPELITLYGEVAGQVGTEEARRIGDVGLEAAQRVLGPEHPTTVEMMVSLVMCHMWDDNKDAALSYCENALRLSQKVLGPDHFSTLATMSNLSYVYDLRFGQLEKAMKLREEALAISRKALGTENPATLGYMLRVAGAYESSGRYADALHLYEEALELGRRVWGPEHYWTTIAAYKLGHSCADVGQLGRAKELLDGAWRLCKKSPNSRSVRLTWVRDEAADMARIMGQYDQAMSLLEEPIELRPNPKETLLVLARTQLDMGNSDRAVALFEEGIRLWDKDPGRPSLDSRGDLAVVYAQTGRHAEAVQLAQDAVKHTRAVFGEAHASTAILTTKLATVLCELKRHADAVPLLESVIPLLKKQLGPESYRTLAAMHQLAVAYHGVGRLEEATALHTETLQLRQKALGPEHPQTLASMILLGGTYVEQGKYAEAEPLLLAAHEGYAKRDAAYPTPYDHSQAREACTQLVQLYEKTNQPDKVTAWKEKLAALTE